MVGTPGDSVELGVRLHSHGHAVVGIQNDLYLDRALPLAVGSPVGTDLFEVDCRVDPAINKPHGAIRCTEPDDLGCITTRAVVLSFDNVDPIADEALVYTCTLPIPADAKPGHYRVACVDPGASDPDGGHVLTRCEDGEIVVTTHAGDATIQRPAPRATGNGCQVAAGARPGSALPMVSAALLALARRRRRSARAGAPMT